MKILIAVKGFESEAFYRQTAALCPLDLAEIVLLVHVIDTGQRAGVELGRDRFVGRRSLGEGRMADIDRAEEERARAGLAFAARVLSAAGVPEGRLREVTLRGKPNEELRGLAEREGVDLVVVGGRGGKPGPHSLGKTARFLIDHAPHAALLIRPL